MTLERGFKIGFITPVQVTTTTGAEVEVDLSPWLPQGARVAIFRVETAFDGEPAAVWSVYTDEIFLGTELTGMDLIGLIPLTPDMKCMVYRDTTSAHVWLIGYIVGCVDTTALP